MRVRSVDKFNGRSTKRDKLRPRQEHSPIKLTLVRAKKKDQKCMISIEETRKRLMFELEKVLQVVLKAQSDEGVALTISVPDEKEKKHHIA